MPGPSASGLPSVEKISEFLKTAAFLQPEDMDYEPIVVIPRSVAWSPSQGSVVEPELRAWVKTCDGFGVDAFSRQVVQLLEERGHPASAPISILFLGLYMMHPTRVQEPIATFNALLAEIRSADLTQFYILPSESPPQVLPFSFGPFTVGPLNLDRLKQRSAQAGSDYHDLYGDLLRNRFSIERERHRCDAVDFRSYTRQFRGSLASNAQDAKRALQLSEAYFQTISQAYFESFWRDFDREQELQVSLGAPYLTTKTLRQILNSDAVSIYERIGGDSGFVAPTGMAGSSLDLVQSDRRIPVVLQQLSRSGFDGFSATRFDRLLQSYTHYMFRGKQHCFDSNHSESFLQYMIALEMLLGEESSSLSSVSRRAAVISYPKLSSEPREAFKRLSKLYDVRSRYVHGGISINPQHVTEIDTIATAVLESLLRVRQRNRSNLDDAVGEHWKKALDYVWSAYEAGHRVPDDELTSFGLEVNVEGC